MFLLDPPRMTPPIELIASAQNDLSSALTLVINKPTGTVDGDLMIAFLSAYGGVAWTGDTSWTEIYDANNIRIAYKIASGEGASYTFTRSDATYTTSGCIVTYRNAVFDVIGAAGVSGSGLVIAPSITAAAKGYLIGFTVAAGSNNYVISTNPTTSNIAGDSNMYNSSWNVRHKAISAGITGTHIFNWNSASVLSAILLNIKSPI